jgi:pimeloyl-ACP methyl ester carboxylesterase
LVGVELAHVRRGSGPTFVVLRQLEKPLWEPVVERLARDREVVAVDLPGMGDSPPLPDGEAPSVEALARAVAGWFASAGLERPHVAGNSLGGGVALELARAAEVGGAAALSPIGLWNRIGAAYALRSLRVARAVARTLGSRTGVMAGNPVGRTLAFGQLMSRPWRLSATTARQMLEGIAGAPGFEETARAVFDYRLRRFEPQVPVTIGWGQRDFMTPPHQARRAQQVLPNARHVILTGCGHSPMVDDPDQVVRVLLDSSRS